MKSSNSLYHGALIGIRKKDAPPEKRVKRDSFLRTSPAGMPIPTETLKRLAE